MEKKEKVELLYKVLNLCNATPVFDKMLTNEIRRKTNTSQKYGIAINLNKYLEDYPNLNNIIKDVVIPKVPTHGEITIWANIHEYWLRSLVEVEANKKYKLPYYRIHEGLHSYN